LSHCIVTTRRREKKEVGRGRSRGRKKLVKNKNPTYYVSLSLCSVERETKLKKHES
jgi:hypothetical protein